MKTRARALLAFLLMLILTFCLCACGGEACEHRDRDDNGVCDKCGKEYTDGEDKADTCEHRDKDDNSACDECGKEYTVDDDGNTTDITIGVESVSLGFTEKTIYRFGTDTLAVSITPQNATNKDVLFESSDTSILTVDENGVIYARGEGCATVTVTTEDGGISAACDVTVMKGGITYELVPTGDFYIAAGCEGYEKEIEIASIYDGLRVKEIKDGAFEGNAYIKSVKIPNTIERIGERAFYNCERLESCVIEKGAYTIGASAFEGCVRLVSISILGEVLLEQRAFYGCNSLSEIVLGERLYCIDKEAFAYCTALTSITLPSGAEEIGEGAFSHCAALESCTLGEGIKRIGEGAFEFCTSLTDICLPNTVEQIGALAFRHNEALRNIGLSEDLNRIGNAAFQYCISLEQVTIPECVRFIEDSAFSGCFGMTELTILGGFISWGNSAFYKCVALERISYRSLTPGSIQDNNYIFYGAGEASDGIELFIGADAVLDARLFTPVSNSDADNPRITKIVFETGDEDINISNAEGVFIHLTEIEIPMLIARVPTVLLVSGRGLTIRAENGEYYCADWYDEPTLTMDAVDPTGYTGEAEFLYPRWMPRTGGAEE